MLKEAMQNYFANGCCGLTPRQGVVLYGVFMAFVCFTHSVFIGGHLQNVLLQLNSTKMTESMQTAVRVIPYLYNVFYGFDGITYMMIFLLFISVHQKSSKGLLIYVCWTGIHEFLNIIFLGQIHVLLKAAELSLPVLEWVGLSLRICLQFFWIVYVITYIIELQCEPVQRESEGKVIWKPIALSYDSPLHNVTQMRRNLYCPTDEQQNPDETDLSKATEEEKVAMVIKSEEQDL